MHSLRRTYGRALQGAVSMQKIRVGSERAYSTKSTPNVALHKSKEERTTLVMQFVTKYKASNNGKLPGISVLRKEVGGKYEILKEILDGIKADKEKLEMEIPAGGSTKPQVLDYSWKRQPLPAKVLKKEKKSVSGMVKGTEIKKDDNVANSRTATEAMQQREQAMTSGRDDSQPIMDISGGSDEDDNDSDVAAPEYQYTRLPQMENLSKLASKRMEPMQEYHLLIPRVPTLTTSADLRAAFEDCGEIFNVSVSQVQKTAVSHLRGPNGSCAAVNFKTEEGLKAAMMKDKVLLRGQLVDLKPDWNRHRVTKLMTFEVKHAKPKYHASKTEAQQNGLDVANDANNEPARHNQMDGDFDFEGKASPSTSRSQHITAVRIVNLPLHVTESKLKSLCESIASVYRVDFGRGQMADVLFNVKEIKERKYIIHRLRQVDVGDCRLKVIPVQRFSCGYKPRDV